jgi:hypothetical protein
MVRLQIKNLLLNHMIESYRRKLKLVIKNYEV